MPRFYGSRMHRPDCDFMYAIAAYADEGVVIPAFVEHGRRGDVALQRVVGVSPGCVPQPGSPVGAIGIDPEQIARRALHAPGRIKNGRQIRIAWLAGGQGGSQPQHAFWLRQREVQRVALAAVLFVRAP